MTKRLMQLVGVVVLAALVATPAFAGEKDEHAEIKKAWQRVEDMYAHAKKLEAEGKHEDAAALMQKAKEMHHRLEMHEKVLKLAHEAEELLEKAKFLKEQGKQDEAMALLKRADEMRRHIAELKGHSKKQDGEAKRAAEMNKLVNMLEGGIHALRKLGKKELAAEVLAVAKAANAEWKAMRKAQAKGKKGAKLKKQPKEKKIKKEGKARRMTEREMAMRHLEIMKAGVDVLVKGGREDSAHQLELAAKALYLRLEGRRDAEANEIYEKAPNAGQMTELLAFASEHAQDQGNKKAAGLLRELSQMHHARWKRSRKPHELNEQDRAAQRKRMEDRHQVPDQKLGLLRAAVVALAEAGRHGPAERVEQAEHWRRLWAEGHRGPDAQDIRRRAPSKDELATHLRAAADLWASWHHPKMGRALDRFANELAGKPKRRRARSGEREELLERIRNLEERVERLNAR